MSLALSWGGGAKKQAERLAGYLASHDKSVWVITRHQHPGFASAEAMNGYNVLRPATSGPGKLKTVTFILGALWHLWRLRRSYKILQCPSLLFGPGLRGCHRRPHSTEACYC